MPVLLLKADFTVPNPLPESNCEQLLLVLPENFEISTLPLRGGCSASELEKRVSEFAASDEPHTSSVGVNGSTPFGVTPRLSLNPQCWPCRSRSYDIRVNSSALCQLS